MTGHPRPSELSVSPAFEEPAPTPRAHALTTDVAMLAFRALHHSMHAPPECASCFNDPCRRDVWPTPSICAPTPSARWRASRGSSAQHRPSIATCSRTPAARASSHSCTTASACGARDAVGRLEGSPQRVSAQRSSTMNVFLALGCYVCFRHTMIASHSSSPCAL